MPSVTDTVGVLLILKAFASGCSALTGVEAIANSVPQFRQPRAQRAQHTEVALGVLLGVMLLGLGELIRRWDVVPQSGTTVLAQLTEGAVGHKASLFYVIQLITLVLLALAANTASAGCRCWPGCSRGTTSCRTCSGCARTAGCSATASGCSRSPRRCCSSSPAATPRRWCRCSRSGCSSASRCPRSGWCGTGIGSGPVAGVYRALINGVGAVLTFAATVIELVSKFLAGRVAGRDRHPAARAAVPRGGPGVRADRRAARDRPGAAAAGEAARRWWSCR